MRLLKIAAGPGHGHERQRAAQFGEDGGVMPLGQLPDAARDPGLRHRRAGTGFGNVPPRRAGREIVLGDRHMAHRDRFGARGMKRYQRGFKRREDRRDLAGQRDIGTEAAHRGAAEQRILADLDDRSVRRRCMLEWRPGRQRVDYQHRVGVGEARSGVVAGLHRMFGRHDNLVRPELDHRKRPAFANPSERLETVGAARTALGEDQWPFGAGQNRCRGLQVGRSRRRNHGSERGQVAHEKIDGLDL